MNTITEQIIFAVMLVFLIITDICIIHIYAVGVSQKENRNELDKRMNIYSTIGTISGILGLILFIVLSVMTGKI